MIGGGSRIGTSAYDAGEPRFSLRTRVTLLAAICVAGAVALVSLGAYISVRNNLYSQLAVDLQQRAEVAVKQEPTQAGPNQSRITFGDQLSISDTRFDIVTSDGSSVVTMPPQSRVDKGLIGVQERGVAAGALDSSSKTARGYQVVAVRYPWIPGTALVLAQPLEQSQSRLQHLAIVLISISGAGVIVAALAGTAVARGGLVPVQRLTQAAERVANTNDLRPIPVAGDDELARLTVSFNAMLSALSESQQRQRQLVADAGHELRTPLTSLRTNMELLLASERPGAPTLAQSDRSEIYSDVRGQLDELTTLIGDLVELARADGTEVVPERVELVDVVERAVERAQRRSGDVTFDVSVVPWVIHGDPGALERAVVNLLDNAVKFSPPTGVVRLGMRQVGDGSVLIEVADSGPGIADADLPRVFDRFYRSSEARTMPGSGLGLAIVRQAVARHGGSVYAGHAAGGGALLTIQLPGQPG